MSLWRAKGLELFPDLRSEIEAAESVGALWIELCCRFDDHYRNPNAVSDRLPGLIPAIYQYATWCTRAKSVDTCNAALVGFYEHVSSYAFRCDTATYSQIVKDLVQNIGIREVYAMAFPFAFSIAPHQFNRFLADCVNADRDRKKLASEARGR